MAVVALPDKFRHRRGPTSTQERLKRRFVARNGVIRIFPNCGSALCLTGALLAEQNEIWQERRYLDRDEFAEWAAAGNGNGKPD